MNGKILTMAVVAAVAMAGAGCAVYLLMGDEDGSGVIGKDVDFVGRAIEPVDDLEGGIVAIGQDSFRWMTYFGLADKCVMIDTNDRTNYMGKAFMYVGRALADVSEYDLNDYTHVNCGITPGDVEHIFGIEPAVVVVPEGFHTDYPNEYRSLVDYGLNVVSIGYIYTFLEPETFKIVDRLDAQIDLIQNVFADVLDTDRGKELKEGIDAVVKDLVSMQSQITMKRSGYIGALAYNGAHGAESSIAYYMPFALAGIDNIMDDGNYTMTDSGVKTYSADNIRQNIKSDTILFLDATGLYMCTDNTSKGIIQLFQDHEAYVACPYIWTGMNYENVLISAYQIMNDAYGLMTDDELKEKIDTVTDLFLGSHISLRDTTPSDVGLAPEGSSVYEDMNHMYTVRRGNPIYGAITIATDGAMTYAAA